MRLSITKNNLGKYINKQIDNFFPDNGARINFNDKEVKNAFDEALYRAEYCFKHINIPGYQLNGEVYFSHLHMDQYSQFLYYLSNSLWNRTENKELCSKLVLLNRALSGAWFSFKGNLPDIFLLIHPVGSVIGHVNVTFSDYLVIMQDVTINSVSTGKLELGAGLFLSAGSKLIGGGRIGNRVSIGSNTNVRVTHIPDDSIVFRDDNTGIVKSIPNKGVCFAQRYFYDDLSVL